MNIYSNIVIGTEDIDIKKELENDIDYLNKYIKNEYLYNCINSEDTKINFKFSDDDYEQIKVAIIKYSSYIFDIEYPYEISLDLNQIELAENAENTIIINILRNINHQFKLGKLNLIYCNDEESLEKHLDSGGCFKLYQKDNWSIVCYNVRNRILLTAKQLF